MVQIVPAPIPQSRIELEHLLAALPVRPLLVQVDLAGPPFKARAGWMPSEGEELPQSGGVSWEAHLMHEAPKMLGERYIHAGAMRIIVQLEGCLGEAEVYDALRAWRTLGVHCGVSLLLETPLERALPIVQEEGLIDTVQLMSIAEIGVQGNPFDERVLTRLSAARALFPRVALSVDGGVRPEYVPVLQESGADRLAVGSFITKSADPALAYATLSGSQ